MNGAGVCLHTSIIPLWGTPLLLHFAAVSSRQEEKQRRREERRPGNRPRRRAPRAASGLQIALGGVGGLAVIAVVVLLATGALGGDSSADRRSAPAADVTLPEQQIGDLKQAADAAGCKLSNPEIEGAQHEEKGVQGLGLQDQPADVRQPLPRVVRRRRLRARRRARPGDARAHARARPHRRPVQARHAGEDRSAARGPARRAERGLPHAAVREHHGHGGAGRPLRRGATPSPARP